jgi:hypothetical protein
MEKSSSVRSAAVAIEIRQLIRTMNNANPTWGATENG